MVDINGQEYELPIVGDNGLSQDTDRELSGELLEQIKKAGNASSFRSVFNQYARDDTVTSCTKFAPFNALCSDIGYSPTLEDILEVEELSIKAGFKIGSGWSRGQGVDVVRRWWNAKFPNQEVFSFVGQLFTDEYYEILKMGMTIICSISVNSRYWGDVLTDGKLDSLDFGPGGGHATAFRAGLTFMDSVGRKNKPIDEGSIYTMSEAQLRFKQENLRTIRSDFHFFIPKQVIKMITKDVQSNQWYSEAVEWAIKEGIMTADKDGKFNPNQNVTRAMLAQVEYNKAKKEGKVK